MDSTTTQSPFPPVDRTNAAAVSPPPFQQEARPLISEAVRQPAWLWLSHVVPVTLVLWSSQYTYSIVVGDLSPNERWASLGLAMVLASIVVASAIMALRGQFRRQPLSNAQCYTLLTMSLTVMASGLTFTEYTLPWTLPEWLVARDELLYRSFAMGMLGAFYPMLILSSYPARRHVAVELAKATGVIFLCLGGTYGFLQLCAALFRDIYFTEWQRFLSIGLAMFVGGTVLSCAVIRTTLVSYTSIRRLHPYGQQTFMFIVAIAGPIGGLWLNRHIEFPVDFQAPIVYLLSLVNGIILMLPVVRSLFWHRAIWLAQCVMFPFSAYFFLVFLPWLPLSPFAMIILGSGFLMLVPLVLGLVHGYRIVDGYREEVRDGPKWKPALLGLIAITVLPAGFGLSMYQDRQSLNEALTYIYSPDYRKDTIYKGDLGRLENSLQHLRNMKHGVYLPFISPIYNTVVFHNLVLPDAKIEELQHAFFGDVGLQQTNALLQSESSSWRGGFSSQPPPSDVVLKDVQVNAKPEDAVTTSRLMLVMQNPTDRQSEFVTTIHLPEGVYVSGFGLYIGKDLVPGRIFEKKTALWVYEKIRNVERRDPGILVYKSRTELELRVFPFESKETRQVEIELVHSSSTPTTISIGERNVALNPDASSSASALATCQTPSGSVAVAEGPGLDGFGFKRQPYLHVLIDCSAGARYSPKTLDLALAQARLAFPEAKMARVSAVNYEIRDLVSDPVPLGKLSTDAMYENLLASRGGFLEDRFLKRGLLQAYDLMQKGAAEATLRPQFVIISPQIQSPIREGHLAAFLALVPDARVIYTQKPDASAQYENMTTHEVVAPSQPSSVVLWQWNDHYAVSPVGDRIAATFPGSANPTGAPLLYQAATGKFVPLATSTAISTTSRFADGVRTWAAQDEASLNPSLLQDGAGSLLGLSKKTGILIPDSSYIVVETSSQWRILEEKEKLKLKNKQVFEFEEPVAAAIPEPGAWIALLFVLVLFLARKGKSLFRRQQPAA